jgi:hypothetical protein
MPKPMEVVDEAIAHADRLKSALTKSSSPQVRSPAEREVMKTSAYAWIQVQRKVFGSGTGFQTLARVDAGYSELLEQSARATRRSLVKGKVKEIRKLLIQLRTEIVANPQLASPPDDTPPDWSPVAQDAELQTILTRRWLETVNCLNVGSGMAAAVMMGGMLEGVLFARVDSLANKKSVFTAATAPKDPRSGNPLQLAHWTLHNFIEVAHELTWILQAAKDLSIVLRDYRNFIHPNKELKEGKVVSHEDAVLMWPVFKSLVQQILTNARANP